MQRVGYDRELAASMASNPSHRVGLAAKSWGTGVGLAAKYWAINWVHLDLAIPTVCYGVCIYSVCVG